MTAQTVDLTTLDHFRWSCNTLYRNVLNEFNGISLFLNIKLNHMDAGKLIQEYPTVNITVTGKDLKDWGESIAIRTAESILQKKEERHFTPKEIEEKFDICPATRWRWDKTGLLKGHRIGRRLYYCESDILELLGKKRRGLDE